LSCAARITSAFSAKYSIRPRTAVLRIQQRRVQRIEDLGALPVAEIDEAVVDQAPQHIGLDRGARVDAGEIRHRLDHHVAVRIVGMVDHHVPGNADQEQQQRVGARGRDNTRKKQGEKDSLPKRPASHAAILGKAGVGAHCIAATDDNLLKVISYLDDFLVACRPSRFSFVVFPARFGAGGGFPWSDDQLLTRLQSPILSSSASDHPR
jgi:hypothetical protein